MQDKETVIKTIRFEKYLVNEIEKMGKDNERDFSSQVRFIIKEYIKLINRK